DISGFWLGFVRYALGDIEGAKKHLRENVEYLDRREEELTAQGKRLPNVQQIFRDFRARDVLMFLEEYQGKPARTDFKSGIRWATARTVDLTRAKGTVMPVLFSKPGNGRCVDVLLELDEYDRAYDGISAMTLGFLPAHLEEAQVEQRVENMLEGLARHGIQIPAGYDETPSTRVFRDLHATVGTATFMVFDSDGKVAWYLPDPRNMDRKIVKRVLDRLLKKEA
ncbi:MAG: hypothetical protein O7J95_11440, partial [Planctomycetota bacterium]|nr:hypothetical protein [Planctomycetota bacterium]